MSITACVRRWLDHSTGVAPLPQRHWRDAVDLRNAATAASVLRWQRPGPVRSGTPARPGHSASQPDVRKSVRVAEQLRHDALPALTADGDTHPHRPGRRRGGRDRLRPSTGCVVRRWWGSGPRHVHSHRPHIWSSDRIAVTDRTLGSHEPRRRPADRGSSRSPNRSRARSAVCSHHDGVE